MSGNYSVEEYERPNGVRVEIVYDEDAGSPAEWDQLGTLYVDSRIRWRDVESVDTSEHDVAAYIRANRMRGNVAVPVRVNDHGAYGATIEATEDMEYANAYMLATQDSARIVGTPPESWDRVLRAEIEDWDTWARGGVYGFVLYGPEGNTLDSLWGMYGIECAREEANSAADSYTAEELYPEARAHVATYA